MDIFIKRATIDDAEIIAPLFDAYRGFYKQATDIEGAKQFISDRLKNNESVIFIAFKNTKAAGFTQLYPIFTSVGMKRTWLLNDLYVDENARGTGTGSALLDAAKQFGIDTGSRWLLLETANDNIPAQHLYEKNNWKKVEAYCFYTLQLIA